MPRLKIYNAAAGTWGYLGGDHARGHDHSAAADGTSLAPSSVGAHGAGAGNTVFSAYVNSDSQVRWLMDAGAAQYFGPGGATPTDTKWYRQADGQFRIESQLSNFAALILGAATPVYIRREGVKWLTFDADGAGAPLTIISMLGALMRMGGAAFPAGPTANDVFYRTDLGMWFFYDGTRWLSTELFTCQLRTNSATVQPYAATAATVQVAAMPSLQGGSDLWIESHMCSFLVAGGGTALGAAHKWVGTVQKGDSAAALTTVATVNIDSGASAAWRRIETAVNALINTPTTFFFFATTWTKTGTPGTLQALEELHYRIVAT